MSSCHALAGRFGVSRLTASWVAGVRVDLPSGWIAGAGAALPVARGRGRRFGVRAILLVAIVLSGALTLSNPGQGLLARFGERGVQVRSDHARLGLRLVGYGYGSALAAVGGVMPRAHANRVVYPHAAGVSEWHANGPLVHRGVI